MKLHELGVIYKDAFDELSKQELSPEIINDSLANLEDDFNSKAVSVATYTSDQDTYIDSIEAEIKRLSSLKKKAVNNRNNYLEYLRYNMDESGISNIKSEVAPFWSITLPKATYQLNVIDEKLIPKEYFNVEVVKKLDKKLVLKHLKEGKEITGAEKILNKPNVRIK